MNFVQCTTYATDVVKFDSGLSMLRVKSVFKLQFLHFSANREHSLLHVQNYIVYDEYQISFCLYCIQTGLSNTDLYTTAVLTMSIGPPVQDQYNFVRISTFFSFYLKLYQNKFKNLIRTSKFKFSFRGLLVTQKRVFSRLIMYPGHKMIHQATTQSHCY